MLTKKLLVPETNLYALHSLSHPVSSGFGRENTPTDESLTTISEARFVASSSVTRKLSQDQGEARSLGHSL